jgi:hypothetical protein
MLTEQALFEHQVAYGLRHPSEEVQKKGIDNKWTPSGMLNLYAESVVKFFGDKLSAGDLTINQEETEYLELLSPECAVQTVTESVLPFLWDRHISQEALLTYLEMKPFHKEQREVFANATARIHRAVCDEFATRDTLVSGLEEEYRKLYGYFVDYRIERYLGELFETETEEVVLNFTDEFAEAWDEVTAEYGDDKSDDGHLYIMACSRVLQKHSPRHKDISDRLRALVAEHTGV